MIVVSEIIDMFVLKHSESQMDISKYTEVVKTGLDIVKVILLIDSD
jgi:hypothetical protein